MLRFFVYPGLVSNLNRCHLTRLLQERRDCLPPTAEALLRQERLGFEPFCAGWAEQFRSVEGFRAPLREALASIEALATPENASKLAEALDHLPREFEVSRYAHPLQQALHLWIIAENTPGVVWPLALESGAGLLPPGEASERPGSDGVAGERVEPTAVEDREALRIEASPAAGSESSEGASEPVWAVTPAAPAGQDSATGAVELSAEFLRLAQLAPAEYDRARRAEAKRLHLRLGTLDKEVNRCRSVLDDLEAERVAIPRTEPWPEAITDGVALYDAVGERYRAYLHLPAGAAEVLALFSGHTHALRAFRYSPRINLLSARGDCGKSTVLKVMATMVAKPLQVQDLKPATVYRTFHKHQPTLLLDECENILPFCRQIWSILNAGASYDACVPRCEGRAVRFFQVFGALVLSGVGDLFETLRSRCIRIYMVSAPEGVKLTRFNADDVALEKELGRKLARWAADNHEALAGCDPPLPACARNRLSDKWRPLFQIAHVLGGHWPELVEGALFRLETEISPKSEGSPQSTVHGPQSGETSKSKVQSSKSENSPEGSPESTEESSKSKVQSSKSEDSTEKGRQTETSAKAEEPGKAELIEDIRRIFAESGVPRLSSRQLVALLQALPGASWEEAVCGGRPLTVKRLSRYLRGAGIWSRNVWVNGCQCKGYEAGDFWSDASACEAVNPANSPPAGPGCGGSPLCSG